MKKKKIIYVVESLGGGVLTYLLQLCNHIDDKFEIYVLYGRRRQTPNNLNKLFNNDVNLIEIKNFQRSLSIKQDFKAYEELKKYINKIHPNIVHLNSSKAGALGRILKLIHFHKYKNTKYFYTPHGYSFLMQNSPKLKRSTYYLIEKMLGNLNTKTIACGYGEYKYANKISSNSTYINNGIDIDKLKKYWTNNSNTEDTIFTIGRINEQKNPKLFNEIATKNPDKKFIWIGDGPQRKYLTASNIEITGWMSNDEVMRRIQPYRYFILCSKWEGLPISLLEAMYFKKVCFVTNVIGNRDIILNEKNGFLFNKSMKLIYIFEDNKDISVEGNKLVTRNYNICQFLYNYKNIYTI